MATTDTRQWSEDSYKALCAEELDAILSFLVPVQPIPTDLKPYWDRRITRVATGMARGFALTLTQPMPFSTDQCDARILPLIAYLIDNWYVPGRRRVHWADCACETVSSDDTAPKKPPGTPSRAHGLGPSDLVAASRRTDSPPHATDATHESLPRGPPAPGPPAAMEFTEFTDTKRPSSNPTLGYCRWPLMSVKL